MNAVLLRADASPQIGAGHAMRCLALGQAARDAGLSVSLLAAALPPAVEDRYRGEDIDVLRGDARPGSPADAARTRAAAAERGAGWIVVDGYAFDEAFERDVRAGGARLLALDDNGTIAHRGATRVLNQNLHARADWYAAEERPLIGPRYALLRREFVARRDERAARGDVARIGVTLGGGRWPGVLEWLLDGLARSRGSALTIDVVADVDETSIAAIETAVARLPRATWRRRCEDMAAWLADLDLVIAAAGGTSWELACMGVPALVVALAPNQEPVAASLHQAGIARDLGPLSARIGERVAAALDELLGDGGARAAMSAAGQALVDGEGAARVAQVLTGAPLRLRRARQLDARLLWEWSNHPTTRAVSFSTDPIPWDVHVEWLRKKLSTPAVTLWVGVDVDDTPVGQIRFEPAAHGCVVSVSTAPDCRGRGVGTALIREASRRIVREGGGPVIAYIRPDNEASARAFVRAGFEPAGRERVHGEDAARLEFSAANL